MRANQLRQLLRKKAGWEQLEFRIPNTFLPPRFRDLSEGRDLLLMLDDDYTVHIRWHNEDFHKHHPLTPGAARRLVGETMKRMKQYKEHLGIFGKFIEEYAEQPLDEERYHDGFSQEKEATQRAKKDGPEEEKKREAQGQEEELEEVTAVVDGDYDIVDSFEELDRLRSQGDSPYPDMNYEE